MLIASFLLSLWAGLIAPLSESKNSTVNSAKASTETAVEATKSFEQLSWSATRRLTWDDFKGSPEDENPHHALTAANLAVDANCKSNKFSYDVKCVFLTEQSWSKNKKSNSLLQHEQLHFDLTEVHARMLRKKLMEMGNSCGNLKGNLNENVRAAFKAWKAEQDLFDNACSHGLNKEEEKAWSVYITKRLVELKEYS